MTQPLHGLSVLMEQRRDHHRDRLGEVMQVGRVQPSCAADILPVMFKRPLDLHQKTFATGEAVAYLHALWYRGPLHRHPAPHGVHRFSAPTRRAAAGLHAIRSSAEWIRP